MQQTASLFIALAETLLSCQRNGETFLHTAPCRSMEKTNHFRFFPRISTHICVTITILETLNLSTKHKLWTDLADCANAVKPYFVARASDQPLG